MVQLIILSLPSLVEVNLGFDNFLCFPLLILILRYVQVLYLVFPRCRVLLDGVHVERYFREKVLPGMQISLYFTYFILTYL